MNTKEILGYILVFVLGGIATYLYFYYDRISATDVILQHNAALGDTLAEIRSDNFLLLRKIAEVKSLNADLIAELDERDERLLTLTRQNLQLKKIVSETTGTINTPAPTISGGGSAFSAGVNTDQQLGGCRGMSLQFTQSTPFYSYTDSVWIDNPPRHKLELSFNPIPLELYLARNKAGIWSNYYKLPKWVESYLSFSDVHVAIETDDYLRVAQTSKRRVDIFFDATVVTNVAAFLFGGGTVILNDTYKISYGKGIGNRHHMLQVGYRLFHIE